MNAASLTLDLRYDLAELERLFDEVQRLGEAAGIGPDALGAVQLALEEIVTNVIRYAHPEGGEHCVQVRLACIGEDVCAEVEDDGPPFNLLEREAPNLSLPLAERPVGGLGIHLVRQLMNHVEYCRQAGHNVVRISRHR